MGDFDSSKAKMIYLPDTMADWPWPRAINPHHEEVKASANAWFHSCNVFTSKAQHVYDKCDISGIGPLLYPLASKEHLRTGCDLATVLFAIDDYTDLGTERAVRELADVVIDALENPHKSRPEGETPLGKLTQEFWALGIKTASPNSQRRLVETFTEFMDTLVQQAADRHNNTFCTIDSYLLHRRKNFAAPCALSIIELGLDLPDHVFYHPTIVELFTHITHLSIFDNDIASYNKEQAVGDDGHNIITVAMRQFGFDLQGAMDWVATYHKEVETKFVDGLKQVPSWGPDMDRQVQQYLEGLACWLRGHDCWNFEGGRYFGSKGREIQRTRWVPLLPKVATLSGNDTIRKEDVILQFVDDLKNAV